MSRRKYAHTTFKGPEPRVRFGTPRRADGSFVGERIAGLYGPLVNGKKVPLVANRFVVQCSSGHALWMCVVAMYGRSTSVQIKCDICGHSVRIAERDLLGIHLLLIEEPIREALYKRDMLGVVIYNDRPEVAYVAAELKNLTQLAGCWKALLAQDRSEAPQ